MEREITTEGCAAGDGSAWSESKSEEVIAALWMIAGLLAWTAEIKWLAWSLFAKAALDVLCSIVEGVREVDREMRATTQSTEVTNAGRKPESGSVSAERFVCDYADAHLWEADEPKGLCKGCPHYRRATQLTDDDNDDWCWLKEGKYADGLWHECPAWIATQNDKISEPAGADGGKEQQGGLGRSKGSPASTG